MACALLGAVASMGAGCAEEPVTVPVRSLARSGRVAFLCIDTVSRAGLPIESCSAGAAVAAGSAPHLHALVTQTTRGEVAVVDLTTAEDPIVDQSERIPGANFLPVGAQPVDVVATEGGTTAFVAIAEIGREGIMALPATQVRPCPTCSPPAAVPTLSSWPACALPSAPGELLIVSDPAVDGAVRATCDGTYEDPAETGLAAEGLGRQKLIVTLPDDGGIAVIDAEWVFDPSSRENPGRPGDFPPCPIERWLPLEVDLPAPALPPAPEPGAGCVNPAPIAAAAQPVETPRPGGMALSDGRLYIADLQAPVIHVVDLEAPCEPVERPPLLPRSVEDPTRVVTTTRVAASRTPSADLRRFLYAIDATEGSTMAFEIGDEAPSRYPIERTHPEWDPLSPRDRIYFLAPAQDLVIVENDSPIANPATGVASWGVRCNPDPDATTCSVDATSCDSGTLYRTAADFTSGAGPGVLRGTFGFVLLSTGQIVIIDIDDLDQACRGPKAFRSLYGCPPPGIDAPADDPAGTEARATSGEVSCNVVLPHAPRDAVYVTNAEAVGRRQPGVQTYPLLADETGTVLTLDETDWPRLHATLPATEVPQEDFTLAVGSAVQPIPLESGLIDADGPRHTLAMNLEDPRAHTSDQQWALVYEGALPGFSSRLAELRLEGDETDGLYDPESRFCDFGVQSRESVREILVAQGATDDEAAAEAGVLADYVQIVSDFPEPLDVHWDSAACTLQECTTDFGTAAAPQPTRDLRVLEAFQDHLILAEPDDLEAMSCCFPSHVTFRVRAGAQWVVTGQASGFIHHVIADPATGRCRNSCEARKARLNGRVRTAPNGALVTDGDPLAFINPNFRLFVEEGVRACVSDADCPEPIACEGGQCRVPPERDHAFRFTTQGAFVPLLINLASQTSDVQPQAMTPIPATGELAVTDGSLEGLLIVSPGSVGISRQIF